MNIRKIILLVLIIIFIIFIYYMYSRKSFSENFTDESNDPIYAKIHDVVFNHEALFKGDVDLIIKNTLPKKDTPILLDAGCGVGRHYKFFIDRGIKDITGVEKNNEILKYAKIRNPTGKFINDTLENETLFPPLSLTHIVCLQDAFYHNKKMEQILENFYYWLKDGGYLCMHIYNRDKLDAGPREFTQYYKGEDGYKHALTYFNSFTHDAHWKSVDDDAVKYVELIVLEDGRKKEAATTLYIPKDKRKIINKVLMAHFRLVNILPIKDEECFELYIFQKNIK